MVVMKSEFREIVARKVGKWLSDNLVVTSIKTAQNNRVTLFEIQPIEHFLLHSLNSYTLQSLFFKNNKAVTKLSKAKVVY